jgi:hypothetical protein
VKLGSRGSAGANAVSPLVPLTHTADTGSKEDLAAGKDSDDREESGEAAPLEG